MLRQISQSLCFAAMSLAELSAGRIIPNKTFFFADYQGTGQLIGRIRTSTAPTLAQRNGNFSTSLGALLYSETNIVNGVSTVTVVTRAVNSINNQPNSAINVTDTGGNVFQLRQGQIFRPSDIFNRRRSSPSVTVRAIRCAVRVIGILMWLLLNAHTSAKR